MKTTIRPVNLVVDSSMDADDYGHRITECIQQLNSDISIVNLVKIDFGNSRIPCEELTHFLKNLKDMFESLNVKNCVFVPIGERCGIKDITVDYIKVIDDDVNTNTTQTIN